MKIRVNLNTNIADGSEVVFRSPADCSQVTGLVIYHHGGKTEFAFADAHGNNVGDIDHLFAENAVVKVILDVTANMAFVQNADTNAYIERTFVKTVNGQAPDASGNVEIKVADYGDKIILDSSHFVQGLYTFGSGIGSTPYWITTNPAIPVNVGDKIVIKPNGGKVTIRLMDSANVLESTIAKVLIGNQEEDTELVADTSGWLCVMVNNANKLTPESYPCEISVGKTEIEKLREEMEELKQNSNSSTTVIPTLSGDLRNRLPIDIIDDCQSTALWKITNTSDDVPKVKAEGHIMFGQCLHSDSQMRCTAKSYDLLNNNLVLRIRVNSIADGAKLLVKLCNKDKAYLNASYELMRGTVNAVTGEWVEIALPYNGYLTITDGDIDFGNINDVTILASAGAVDWDLQYIGLRPKVLNTGIVSFTFDDGYKSQYTGIKLLAEKGITGTVYPSLLSVEEGDTQLMTIRELQELVNLYGTHIGMHHATIYDQMTLEELESHWTEYQKIMRESGLGDGRHLAYPGGRHPAEVVQLARSYFDSCRTINGFAHAEAYPPVDNYRVKAISSIGAAGNGVDYIKDKIDRAVASGSWLILVFHRIEDGDTTSHCSEAELSAIADYALASGAKVMNVAEVYNSGYCYGTGGAGNANGGGAVDLSGYAKKTFVEEKIAEAMKSLDIPETGNGVQVSGAEVGQYLRVANVDDNGVPTAWETAEMPTGGSNAFRLIRDITIPEDITTDTSGVNYIYADDEQTSVRFGFDTDANGKPFELTELLVVTTKAGTTATADNVARIAFDSAIPDITSMSGITIYGVSKNSGTGQGISQITLLDDGNAFSIKTNFGGGNMNAVQSSAKLDGMKVNKISKVRVGTQNAGGVGFTIGSQFRFYGR